MTKVRLSKTELRFQQNRLKQLEKYLPTLQLKKAMLQAEVSEARSEIIRLEKRYADVHHSVGEFSALLTDRSMIDPQKVAAIREIHRRFDNIAGVEVPYFESVEFEPVVYGLFETPPWIDEVIAGVRGLVEARVKIQIAREKKAALEKELREVSIRVNLFEKVLIPRALGNIKRIKVFLGDQELAAVSQAKVAKRKIEMRKRHAY